MMRLFIVAIALSTLTGNGAVHARQMSAAAQACAALAGMNIPASRIGLPTTGALVASAQLVPAAPETKAAPGPGNPSGVTMARPEYCEVKGAIRPVDPTAPPINFQLNLPTEWNGKAVHQGGGGYDGFVVTALGSLPRAPDTTPYPITRGYATFGSDSGHEGNDASFALNAEALQNFAHGHVKKTRDVAVALMTARYGSAPRKVYFVGQSGGGRTALLAAQRYPQDYDGVVATAPAVRYTGVMMRFNDTASALAHPGAFLGAEHVAAFDAAVRAQCDLNDGVADGIVGNYLACNFNPAALRCRADSPAPGCFSDAQIGALNAIYQPTTWKDKAGKVILDYPRFLVGGGESRPGGLTTWITGRAPMPRPQPAGKALNVQQLGVGNGAMYGNTGVRYLIARDPALDTVDFDPTPYARQVTEAVDLLATDNPDLSPFNKRGGKVIILHNTADLAVSPVASIDYYNAVVKTVGASTVQQFVRMYIVPGGDHGGANAPSKADLLGMLDRWVETGAAPASDAVAEEYGPDRTVTRTKPLCVYPTYPHYTGSGDPKVAASYRCAPVSSPTGTR